MIRIGIDAMGGDFAPQAVVLGAIQAARQLAEGSRIVLFGDKARIEEILSQENCPTDTFDIVPTSEVIEMGDNPTQAFSKKPDSSIVVGFRYLLEGKIDGFASAGSTGAMMVGCMYTVKQIDGVIRPAISVLAPTIDNSQVLLLDVGLNVDCKPDVLYQYGIIGSTFAKGVMNKTNPRVALLNIGEEKEKGNLQTKATYELMENTSEFNFVPFFLAYGGNDADGGGLAVDYADCRFVGDNGGYGVGGGVTGNGYHIQPHAAHRSHRFEFFYGKRAFTHRFYHTDVFADGNKRARQAANVRTGHSTAFFDGVVEHSKTRGGAVSADDGKPHCLKHFAHAVVADGGGRERKVDYAELRADGRRGFSAHEFAHTGDFESGILDCLGEHVATLAANVLEGGFHHSGARNADVDYGIAFAYSVERTRHKRVILDGVGEHDEFCAPYASAVGGEFRGFFDNFAHKSDGVHIYARSRRTDVHRSANTLGRGKHFGNGKQKLPFFGGHRLLNERGITADEIYAVAFCRFVHSLCDERVTAACRANQTDGRNGKTLIDNGYTVFCLNVLGGGNEFCRKRTEFASDILRRAFGAVGNAVEKADMQCDRAYVEVLVLYHTYGLYDFLLIEHTHLSDSVHRIEDILVLCPDFHAEFRGNGSKSGVDVGNTHSVRQGYHHNHREIRALHNGLRDVLDVDVHLVESARDLGNDTRAVSAYNGNNGFHYSLRKTFCTL